MNILDGKGIANLLKKKLCTQVAQIKEGGEHAPHLAIILIGHDPASHTYVHAKIKACKEVGFQSTLIQYATISEVALLRHIAQVNADPTIDGLIVQLPLPKPISIQKVINHIHPDKDVDGFHALNYGRMARNLPAYLPATPLGILTLLEHYQIPTSGKTLRDYR